VGPGLWARDRAAGALSNWLGGGVKMIRPRRMWRGAVTAAGIAMALAACGAQASPPGPAVGVDFAAKARSVCEAALGMKQSQGSFPFPDFNPTKPDPSKLPAVAAFLAKTDTTFSSWSTAMKALGEPASGQDGWDRLVAAIDKHVELNRGQIDAAQNGDVTRFAADYKSGTETQAVLLAAATAAGVVECAKVDR
jgi:hypothetical protein